MSLSSIDETDISCNFRKIRNCKLRKSNMLLTSLEQSDTQQYVKKVDGVASCRSRTRKRITTAGSAAVGNVGVGIEVFFGSSERSSAEQSGQLQHPFLFPKTVKAVTPRSLKKKPEIKKRVSTNKNMSIQPLKSTPRLIGTKISSINDAGMNQIEHLDQLAPLKQDSRRKHRTVDEDNIVSGKKRFQLSTESIDSVGQKVQFKTESLDYAKPILKLEPIDNAASASDSTELLWHTPSYLTEQQFNQLRLLNVVRPEQALNLKLSQLNSIGINRGAQLEALLNAGLSAAAADLDKCSKTLPVIQHNETVRLPIKAEDEDDDDDDDKQEENPLVIDENSIEEKEDCPVGLNDKTSDVKFIDIIKKIEKRLHDVNNSKEESSERKLELLKILDNLNWLEVSCEKLKVSEDNNNTIKICQWKEKDQSNEMSADDCRVPKTKSGCQKKLNFLEAGLEDIPEQLKMIDNRGPITSINTAVGVDEKKYLNAINNFNTFEMTNTMQTLVRKSGIESKVTKKEVVVLLRKVEHPTVQHMAVSSSAHCNSTIKEQNPDDQKFSFQPQPNLTSMSSLNDHSHLILSNMAQESDGSNTIDAKNLTSQRLNTPMCSIPIEIAKSLDGRTTLPQSKPQQSNIVSNDDPKGNRASENTTNTFSKIHVMSALNVRPCRITQLCFAPALKSHLKIPNFKSEDIHSKTNTMSENSQPSQSTNSASESTGVQHEYNTNTEYQHAFKTFVKSSSDKESFDNQFIARSSQSPASPVSRATAPNASTEHHENIDNHVVDPRHDKVVKTTLLPSKSKIIPATTTGCKQTDSMGQCKGTTLISAASSEKPTVILKTSPVPNCKEMSSFGTNFQSILNEAERIHRDIDKIKFNRTFSIEKSINEDLSLPSKLPPNAPIKNALFLKPTSSYWDDNESAKSATRSNNPYPYAIPSPNSHFSILQNKTLPDLRQQIASSREKFHLHQQRGYLKATTNEWQQQTKQTFKNTSNCSNEYPQETLSANAKLCMPYPYASKEYRKSNQAPNVEDYSTEDWDSDDNDNGAKSHKTDNKLNDNAADGPESPNEYITEESYKLHTSNGKSRRNINFNDTCTGASSDLDGNDATSSFSVISSPKMDQMERINLNDCKPVDVLDGKAYDSVTPYFLHEFEMPILEINKPTSINAALSSNIVDPRLVKYIKKKLSITSANLGHSNMKPQSDPRRRNKTAPRMSPSSPNDIEKKQQRQQQQQQQQTPNMLLYNCLQRSPWFQNLMSNMKIQINQTISELVRALNNFQKERLVDPSVVFDVFKMDCAGELLEIMRNLGIFVDPNGVIIESKQFSSYVGCTYASSAPVNSVYRFLHKEMPLSKLSMDAHQPATPRRFVREYFGSPELSGQPINLIRSSCAPYISQHSNITPPDTPITSNDTNEEHWDDERPSPLPATQFHRPPYKRFGNDHSYHRQPYKRFGNRGPMQRQNQYFGYRKRY